MLLLTQLYHSKERLPPKVDIMERKAVQTLKLVSHWDATNWLLVGDKGLRFKRDFSTIFTLRSHWNL